MCRTSEPPLHNQVVMMAQNKGNINAALTHWLGTEKGSNCAQVMASPKADIPATGPEAKNKINLYALELPGGVAFVRRAVLVWFVRHCRLNATNNHAQRLALSAQ